jgi:hypothetical protein
MFGATDSVLSGANIRIDLMAADGNTVAQQGAGGSTFLAQNTSSVSPSDTLSVKQRFALSAASVAGQQLKFFIFKGGSGNCQMSSLITSAIFFRE